MLQPSFVPWRRVANALAGHGPCPVFLVVKLACGTLLCLGRHGLMDQEQRPGARPARGFEFWGSVDGAAFCLVVVHGTLVSLLVPAMLNAIDCWCVRCGTSNFACELGPCETTGWLVGPMVWSIRFVRVEPDP